jgi:hypothetical protein
VFGNAGVFRQHVGVRGLVRRDATTQSVWPLPNSIDERSIDEQPVADRSAVAYGARASVTG